MVPDYISEKKMRELKLSKGETAGPRRRVHLHGLPQLPDAGPVRQRLDNVANAGNYEPGKPKYYGRFNQGVVTINLVDVALSSGGEHG